MPFRSNKENPRDTPSNGWVTVKVNLRTSQYEALRELADELGLSPSRVTRRVLAQFLAKRKTGRPAKRKSI